MCFALWWTFNILNRYFRSLRKNGVPYRNTTTFHVKRCCRRQVNWEVEGIIKILVSVGGVLAEIITGFTDGQFLWMGNIQHALIYVCFGVAGIVDILVFYGASIPKKSSYITMIFAFFVQTVVFRFHLDGRADLDVLLHTITMYVTMLTVISWIAEMAYETSMYVALARSYFMFAQGTTLWQAAFMLFSPIPNAQPWDDESPDTVMLTTSYFVLHLTFDLVFFFGLTLFIGRGYRDTESDTSAYAPLKVPQNGIQITVQDAESGSDFEDKLPLTRVAVM